MIKTFHVEVTRALHVGIAGTQGPFHSVDAVPISLQLDTSKWPAGLPENRERRRILDVALFAIRLWRSGLFGLRRAACGGSIYPTHVGYYDLPWITWNSGKAIEKNLDFGVVSEAQDEIQAIAEQVNTIEDLENPILRRFGYFYFYPVGLDRLLTLTMACDGLLFPDFQKDCNSKKENFKQRMCFLRSKMGGKPAPPKGVTDGHIYDARNGLSHGSTFGTTTKSTTLDIEGCSVYLDEYLRNAIQFFLRIGLVGDRPGRAAWLKNEKFPCPNKR